mgnify:CR=1 FL=1
MAAHLRQPAREPLIHLLELFIAGILVKSLREALDGCLHLAGGLELAGLADDLADRVVPRALPGQVEHLPGGVVRRIGG